ncbi:hypothetical protein V6N13_064600 [Hibiscus sabdariffa]
MVDPPDDSRLPKKQRRRDETPSEIHSHDHPPATTIECDNSIIPKPAASYRDMRRQARKSAQSIHADIGQDPSPTPGNGIHIENSRFNPIFVDNNDANDLANQADTPSVPDPVPIPPVSTPSGKENIDSNVERAKAKGKSGIPLLKPPFVSHGKKVLSHVSGRKHEVHGASSSRSPKNHGPIPTLNPQKHSAIELSMSLALISGSSLRSSKSQARRGVSNDAHVPRPLLNEPPDNMTDKVNSESPTTMLMSSDLGIQDSAVDGQVAMVE